MSSGSPITSHILDTTLGKPAANVKIILYKYDSNAEWIQVNTNLTNSDGRSLNLLKKTEFTIGFYKLRFDGIDEYFRRNGQTSLYPFIEITFNCTSMDEHYHIPLLLNPYGYSTYRGS